MVVLVVFVFLFLSSLSVGPEPDGSWEKKYSVEQSWKEQEFPDVLGSIGRGESEEIGFFSQEEPSEEHRVKRESDFEGSATTTAVTTAMSMTSPSVTTAMSTTSKPCIVYKISSVIKFAIFPLFLLDKFGVPFAKFVAGIVAIVDGALNYIKLFKKTRVSDVRKGSIIVDMEIEYFKEKDTPKEHDVQKKVDAAIQSASTFIIETLKTTATSTTIGTTETTTIGTTAKRTKEDEDTVTFEVVITIDEPFDPFLNNPESAAFKNMRNRFVNFLEPLYQNISEFREIVVNSFSEGSIVADIDVKFNITQTTPTVQVIEAIIIKAKDDGSAPFIIQSLRVTKKYQKVDEELEVWKMALIAGVGAMMLIMVFSLALICAVRQKRKWSKRSGYNLDGRRNSFELDYSFFSYDMGKTD